MKTLVILPKEIICILLLSYFLQNATTQTVITASGTISDSTTWDADTVKVTGDVTVDGTLTIKSGTYVEFQGFYSITGEIHAMGAPGDMIYFTIHDTTGFSDPDSSLGGWNHIKITGNSQFRYCKFQYAKHKPYTIYLKGDNKHLELQNCIITNMSDGICNKLGNCSLSLKNCTIQNIKHTGIIGTNINVDNCLIKNTKCGISGKHPGNLKITNCLIESNEEGICLYSSNAVISGNTIQDNDYGIRIHAGSGSLIINNIIRNNSEDGIITMSSNNISILNNLITNNFHGINLLAGSFGIINNTITNNKGYGIMGSNITALLYNCIIRRNNPLTKKQIFGNNNGDKCFHGDLYNNNFEAIQLLNIVGSMIDNIDMDPLFIDTLNSDFRLQNNSPCINTGTSDTSGLYLPEFDLDGNPRLYGGRIDIGAYESQTIPPGCYDQVFSGDAGIISDQSDDLDYENNAECYKTIIVDEGKRIVLEFTEFDTEEGYDWVYVYDGEYPAGRTLGVFSGNTIPGKVFSSGNKMLVVFRSDKSVTKSGWSANYKAVCPCVDEIFTADSGFIRSNPEGQNYLAYESCYKRIIAEKGKRIVLEFEQFELGSSYDCLVIHDSLHANWPSETYSSHSKLPITHESTGNEVLIRFYTLDRGTQGLGWAAKYRTVQTCYDEILTSGTGTVQNNPEGEAYLNNEDCVKKIITDEGKHILLEFDRFELEFNYDWLRIYDGTYPSSPLIGTFTGNVLPETIQSAGNALYIHFHSDNSVVKSGFSAVYSVLPNTKSTEKPSDMISGNIQDIDIYPNPTNGEIVVIFENEVDKVIIQLLNLQGQIIRNTIEYPANRKLVLDFSKFGSGLYFLKVTTNRKTFEKKLIIER